MKLFHLSEAKFLLRCGFLFLALFFLCVNEVASQKDVPPKAGKTVPKATPKVSLTAAETALEKAKKFIAENLYAEAIIELNQAVRLDPKLAEAFLQRAVAHGERGNLDLSRQDALQAIRLKPDLARAYNVLGKTYEQEKLFDVAVSNYGKAIELDPKYIAAYNNRGFAYAALKMYDEAIRDFTQAIRLDIKNAFAYYENRGIVHGLKGDFAKAADDFSQTLKLKPKRAKTFLMRAAAYRKLGKIAEAEADEQFALDLETEQ